MRRCTAAPTGRTTCCRRSGCGGRRCAPGAGGTSLPEPTRADLRAFVGWAQSSEEVRAGKTVDDTWLVLGAHRSDDGRLLQQRTWLRGTRSGEVVQPARLRRRDGDAAGRAPGRLGARRGARPLPGQPPAPRAGGRRARRAHRAGAGAGRRHGRRRPARAGRHLGRQPLGAAGAHRAGGGRACARTSPPTGRRGCRWSTPPARSPSPPTGRRGPRSPAPAAGRRWWSASLERRGLRVLGVRTDDGLVAV
nr:hypothetical protein [Angustibacter aerolatus]